MRSVDVAILGAGTAGLNARRAAERAGAEAVMIDPGPFGTTCARVGCMPSKLLIAAAETVHQARQGRVFGFDADVAVDGRRVMDRVRRERDRFVGFVMDDVGEHLAADRLIRGRGRLVGPHTIQVDDRTVVEARAIVVATGSRPFIPAPYRGLGDVLLDNEGVFELQELPASLLVVGAGVIGLELGQAMHRLGVRVQIIGRNRSLGGLADPRVVAEAHRVFEGALDLHTDARDVRVERVAGGARVRFAEPGGQVYDDVFERVLVATGRVPNLEGLGLAHAGIQLASPRPRVDPATMQLGGTHVFLAGDVSGARAVLHEASDEGRIAGANAAGYPELRAHPRRVKLGIVFTDPQLAVVGDARALHACPAHRAGEVSYANQGRARVMHRHQGRVRVYAEVASGRLKGAEMMGPAVEHTAHLLAWAVQSGMTVTQALAMPFYHPVVEEGIRTALQDLQRKLRAAGCAGGVGEGTEA